MWRPGGIGRERSIRLRRAGLMLVPAAAFAVPVMLPFAFAASSQEQDLDGVPTRWKVSYVDVDGRPVVRTVNGPMGQDFFETIVRNGAITIEFTVPQCQAFDSYRFWVGPWGIDSTGRQPARWDVFVRRDAGGSWIKADAEDTTRRYANKRWYRHRLTYGEGCASQVKMEISRMVGRSDVLRMYQIVLHHSSRVERALAMIGL